MNMACDRFAFSTTGNTASRRVRRRSFSVEHQVSRMPTLEPPVRHRASRVESLLRDGVEWQLAAAEARIAELEAAVREAHGIASHDPLTGVYNRRGMNEAFVRETARARRTGQPLALALIDLDDFKRINDHHGHAVGDAALVHLTRIVAQTLRPTDLCCRLGGEEFVVVMPGADRAVADRVLARLQAAVAVQPVAETLVTLAFSAGVVLAETGESLEQTLMRADRAVYRAKAAGKGRIVNG
jgi:diguanylate cyclase